MADTGSRRIVFHKREHRAAIDVQLKEESAELRRRERLSLEDFQQVRHQRVRLGRAGEVQQRLKTRAAVRAEQSEDEFVCLFEHGRASFDNRHSGVFEGARGGADGLRDFGRGRDDAVVRVKGDAQGFDFDRRRVAERDGSDRRVAPVRAAQERKREREVFDATRERADLTE